VEPEFATVQFGEQLDENSYFTSLVYFDKHLYAGGRIERDRNAPGSTDPVVVKCDPATGERVWAR